MDLQNVSSLVIPEGNVRTIHDKNNRLLWGKLSYNTKYAGNAVQDGTPTPNAPVAVQVVTGTQTVTVRGKNLINNNELSYVATNGEPSYITLTTIPTGIRFSYSGTGNPWVAFKSINLSGLEGKTIRMSCTYGSGGTNYRLMMMNEAGTDRVSMTTSTASGETISFTVPNDLGNKPYLGYRLLMTGHSTVDFTNLIITADNSDMSYESYQSQDYTVNLGTTELVKIGDHQDYIYKSGDDWYVHKEIGKLVLDGTEETWYQWNYSSAFITVLDAINPSTRTTGIVMSDRFIEGASTTQGIQWNNFPNGTVAIRQFTDQPKIGFKTDVATDLATWKTWLSTHNTTVYYVLATPTDTQITDTTLISQLDAIHQFLTRYGYNFSVTGNLPLIINRTVLS